MSRIKKSSDVLFLGSYAFGFGSEGTLPFRSAMLSATLNTNHDALLNLENAATKVCPPLNQAAITVSISVREVQSYKMFQVLFTVKANRFLKNTANKVAVRSNGRTAHDGNSGI
jgi:putative NADPH-quinone reductase